MLAGSEELNLGKLYEEPLQSSIETIIHNILVSLVVIYWVFQYKKYYGLYFLLCLYKTFIKSYVHFDILISIYEHQIF